MNSFVDFALDMVARNPQIAGNPNAREMIDVIRSGDSRRGQMIAGNLCDANNVTPDEAVRQAKGFFGFR